MELFLLYFKGLPLFYDIFLSLKIVFILANTADPDEMPPYAAFHLGFHCLLFSKVPDFWNLERKRVKARRNLMPFLIYFSFPES